MQWWSVTTGVPGSPGAAPFNGLEKGMIDSGDHEVHVPPWWMHKELHRVVPPAYEHGALLPAVNTVRDLSQAAVRGDCSEKDHAALFQCVVGK